MNAAVKYRHCRLGEFLLLGLGLWLGLFLLLLGFRSLTETIDTTSPAGRMMMQMVGAFAEFERAMLRERTKAVWKPLVGTAELAGDRPS
jgi:Resolvase, N terminal domain